MTESDKAAIVRLAALSPMEYDRLRKSEAERLGVSVVALDREVKAHRSQHKEAAGEAAIFREISLWPEEVAPGALLDELAATFRRYAVLPEHADTALALWVAFSWCIDHVDVAPILALTSPEKQCGKTTVLDLTSRLARRALPTANITPASLFRAIETWQPSMIIDEADTFLRESDELRGVLNSGHTRATAFVIRTVGDDHEPRRFNTWGAKAIALIGKMADTLQDRSITIALRRKLPGEKTEKLRHADKRQFEDLQSRLARFAADDGEALRGLRPSSPEGLSDRAADNWEPLLAIAALAGEEWQRRALLAAIALSGRISDALSLGVELLADIEAVFDAKAVSRLPTAALIDALCEDDERPWATYNRGKPMSPRQVARLLSGYKIESKTLRFDYGSPAKGYERAQFTDAFNRYLHASPDLSVTPLQAPVSAGLSVTDSEKQEVEKTLSVTEKARFSAVCNGVTDKTAGNSIVEIEL